MGGSASEIRYAVPISDKPEHETAVYRSPEYKDKLLDRPEPHLGTMKDIFINSSNKYRDRRALGKIVTKQNESHIQYITYRQLVDTAQRVGSGIEHMNLANRPEGQQFRFIGIFSRNRPEWTIVDVACGLYGLTTVPIYDTLGDENVTYVFQHTQMNTLFVNDYSVRALMKCKNLVKVTTLVCFDPFTEEQVQYFSAKGVKLVNYEQVVRIGKQNLVDFNAPQYKVLPSTCLTFSYTSGTTGPPKGAMISHNNFTSFVVATKQNADARFTEEDVAISYLPLPHILEREFLFSLIYAGVSIVYFRGDLQKLKDDIALIKPTVFVSVPRLYSRFYDVIKGKFKDLTGLSKRALDHAVNVKLETVTSTGEFNHYVYDTLFFSKTKEALGGNVRWMVSGSAPLLPDVHSFMKVCMSSPLCEGYGQTESTGCSFITEGRDSSVGHVGGPTVNFEFKLVDIPEMNYLSTDKDEKGRSTPRGEIWVRGPGVFLGYYHDPVKTAETVTPDGWLRTGDVGALHPETRAMKIVDRKKNIFKLQQGEYVAAQKVENIYLKCDALAEIFIHGDSTETFVVAVAVVHRKWIEQIAAQLKLQGSHDQQCDNYNKHCSELAIRCELTAQLNQIGKVAGLQSFEQVKNLHIEPETFMARGIVTNTMKVQRHEAKKYYRPVIDQLYKEGMLKIDKK